jgi:hypothetical protein
MCANLNLETDKYVVGSLAVLVVMLAAMIGGGPIGQVAFSAGTILFFALFLLIGTQSSARRHSPRPFVLLAAGLVLILGIGFALLWHFHFQNPSYTDPTYWFGFPRATAVVIYAIWMPPALYLMFAYPYLFEKYIWNETQAEEFRQMNTKPAAAVADGGEEDEN